MLVVNLITGLFIVLLGFLVKRYPNLISGYNTMSQEKKKNVDINAVTSLYKKGFIIIGNVIIFLSLISYIFDLKVLSGIAMVVPLIIGVIVLLIMGQKYDKNKRSKVGVIFSFSAIFVITIIVLIVHGARPTKIELTDKSVKFTGQYGVNIDIDQIEQVKLLNTIPNIKVRTNGLGLGNIQKGHFILDEYGKCRLFLRLPNHPYLFMQLKDGQKIIFNSVDSMYTKNVYDQLINKIN